MSASCNKSRSASNAEIDVIYFPFLNTKAMSLPTLSIDNWCLLSSFVLRNQKPSASTPYQIYERHLFENSLIQNDITFPEINRTKYQLLGNGTYGWGVSQQEPVLWQTIIVKCSQANVFDNRVCHLFTAERTIITVTRLMPILTFRKSMFELQRCYWWQLGL